MTAEQTTLQCISYNVRALREARNLSREELAVRSGVSYSRLAQIERKGGCPPGLRFSALLQIADALGVRVGDLFCDVERS